MSSKEQVSHRSWVFMIRSFSSGALVQDPAMYFLITNISGKNGPKNVYGCFCTDEKLYPMIPSFL